ncbi:type II toxin-antitoxin system RelE/ParE family toxin [Brevundimonas sp. UBA7664]|uniref:type II toxin-antitoxin system RelE/ParE family toxin n=1 Tax=Brevundimonas sp. UBA7664 TaxID=1946141 RepID=UPI0025BFDD0A|nr:type II toxin-antitoxin system RelE/ParE family toxin [Brevundimonas sp. UBA7664]
MENAAEITGYVRDFSPAAAARLDMQFVSVAESLETFPERGRPIGRGRREVLVLKPYVMRYVLVSDEVRVLSIRHGARRPLS